MMNNVLDADDYLDPEYIDPEYAYYLATVHENAEVLEEDVIHGLVDGYIEFFLAFEAQYPD